MGLKISVGGSAWPIFFGFAEHKTFVEYFGVTEFAKPQTKTRLGLSISIYPSAIQRLRKGGVWREDGEDTAPAALSSHASPKSLPSDQPLSEVSSEWGQPGDSRVLGKEKNLAGGLG